MSFGDTAENAILNLLLNGISYANIADDAASAPETSLYVHLHTADPGESGSSSTNEATFGGYARQAVARDSGSPFWTVSGGEATPSSAITFPTVTSGTETLTHASICKSGGELIVHGVLTPPVDAAAGKTITLPTTTAFALD